MKKIILFLLVIATANVTLGQRNKRGNQSEEVHAPSAPHIAAYEHALGLNDFATAISCLNYVVSIDGKESPYRDTLLMLYSTNGNLLQSYNLAMQLREDGRDTRMVKEVLAEVYNQSNQPKEAIEELEKLYAEFPSLGYLWQIANLQYQLQRNSECLESLTAIINDSVSAEIAVPQVVGENQQQRTSLLAASLNMVGLMLAKQEDYANAIKLFGSASQADPEFILPKQNYAAVTELMQGEAAGESEE
ncbi:MAG: tetratricopeptide repeat protein [Chitinophagales bacterium]